MSENGVVLISTYELGHQPFGLAEPAALLRSAGAVVNLQDLSIAPLDERDVREAVLVALYLPMHTATRLAQRVVPRVRAINPNAHICAYGLYAPLNEQGLRDIGVSTVLGGECEDRLVTLYRQLTGSGQARTRQPQRLPVVSTNQQRFVTPDRSSLPPLENYAHLVLPGGERRVVGYTESTRGCKHHCLHCPIVPVYQGRFRVVPRDVVIDDVRGQVARGAEHITFGDPDFFNGPVHAMRLVRELHDDFPHLSYDVTIKIEHLRQSEDLIEELAATGCILITSAVESFDAAVLERLDKRHTPQDIEAVVDACRRAQVALNPTFVAFSPWTTTTSYREFLQRIEDLDLVANVTPVQYAIRLLVTAQSRLLALPEVATLTGAFDDDALCYPWEHPDKDVDELWHDVMRVVGQVNSDVDRAETFRAVRDIAFDGQMPGTADMLLQQEPIPDLDAIPHLTEPWYCCAEPTEHQLAQL